MFFKKKLLSENDFSEKFAKELLKRVKNLKISSIDNLEIKTKFKDSKEILHLLNNCYSEYTNEPKSINEIIDRYIKGACDLYLPKEIVNLERILPVIKDKRFINELRKLNPEFETKHIFESYNDEIFIFYVEDKENSIHYLSLADLEEIGFPKENLRIKSLENLSDYVSIERHGEDGLYMLTVGGNYESSLILLDIWYKENFEINGEFVIGIPARDILYITGSKDSENLHKLYDLIKEIDENGDHLVSDKIFEFKSGKFETM